MGELVDRFKRLWLIKKLGKDHLERSFVSVRKASRMGVLYHADEEYSGVLLKKLSKWCQDHHITLMAMGYVNKKELAGNYTPHRNSDFFSNKHLSRWKLPVKDDFIRFAGERMDYLLNLYTDPCMPLLGISSFSEAKFRVGAHMLNYEFCFDLMLETKTTDVLVLTDEILNYLETFGDGKI